MYKPIPEEIEPDQSRASQSMDMRSKSRQYKPSYWASSYTSTTSLGSPIRKSSTQPNLNNLRRTTGVLPPLESLHSAPTVASSRLIASTSTNAVPTLRFSRVALRSRNQPASRIPTPVNGLKGYSQEKDSSSPSTGSQKENTAPLRYILDSNSNTSVHEIQASRNMPEEHPHRLMGPTQQVPRQLNTLSKSKTMSMISNLTSTIQRSTSSFTLTTSRSMSLSNRQASSPNSRNESSSNACSSPDNLADPREVSKTMPTPYWTGRYVALHDRFDSEFMNMEVLNTPDSHTISQVLVDDEYQYKDATSKGKGRMTTSISHHGTQADRGHQNYVFSVGNAVIAPDSERTAKRVFVYLDSLCVTEEARKSLWAFQQAYARQILCEALLPLGGTMVAKESVLTRASRLFGGGNKSSFNLGRNRRNSAAPVVSKGRGGSAARAP